MYMHIHAHIDVAYILNAHWITNNNYYFIYNVYAASVRYKVVVNVQLRVAS
jgi:hypothetical protein